MLWKSRLVGSALTLALIVGAIAVRAQEEAPHSKVHKLPHATVTELMTKDLKDYPGKEAETILVEFVPGAVDPIHRHDAHAFVYVLEGSIVMGLKGQKEVTLNPGDVFYEGPNDIHTVGRNASATKPAKFLVTLLKKRGAPVVLPVK
ncbi:MAG: cupin domain-containing protein [Polyangiales bacterium]